ncbi:MAG: CopG family transcriptional regulator, partial [Thermodesulfobacteriota bacterium]
YQSMLNDALRKHIDRQDQPLEEILRRVVREELRSAH